MENILDFVKKLNLSMDHVALLCGMDTYFKATRSTDDFIPEDPREEEYLCENYAEGIVMCIETKRRKRDDGND